MEKRNCLKSFQLFSASCLCAWLIIGTTYAAKPTHYGFTANQPPKPQPASLLWHSLYAWGKKHPHLFPKLCRQKSFRCSVKLSVLPGQPASAFVYTTFNFFSLHTPKTYMLTQKGWQLKK